MKFKEICNKRGSTLAYVIVAMSILMVLGAAIINVTLAGYYMKIDQHHEKTAQRLAEAGLNEAYAYLNEEVENAINYSRRVYVPAQLLNDPSVEARTSDSDYQNELKRIFQNGYKAYFQINRATILDRLENAMTVGKVGSYDVTTGEIIDDRTIRVIHEFSDVQNTMEFEVITQATKTDKQLTATNARRRISANLVIGVPNNDVAFERETQTIKKNALLDLALAADRNLFVSGGEVTITGDATILGYDGKFGISRPENAGGVIVGGRPKLMNALDTEMTRDFTSGVINSNTNGVLNVTGDLNTNRFVRIAYSRAGAKSTINVDGSVRCNSLAVQDGEDGNNSDATIKVTQNASVLDDLDFEAKDSTVEISGSYFGFSIGKETHDQSSSIVINNQDFGKSSDTSTITIKGGSSIVLPGGATSPVAGTYLAGTIYADEGKRFEYVDGTLTQSDKVDILVLQNGTYKVTRKTGITGAINDVTFQVRIRNSANDVDSEYTIVKGLDANDKIMLPAGENEYSGYVVASYQTGDSVSVAGNYLLYSRILRGATVPAEYRDLDELTHFEPFEPLFVVNRKKNKDNLTGDPVNMDFDDKAQYSQYAYVEDSSDINIGNNKLDLQNLQYVSGAFFNKGETGITSKANLISEIATLLENLNKEYKYHARAFSDPQHTNYLTDLSPTISSNKTASIADWIKDDEVVGGLTYPNIQSTSNSELYYIKSSAIDQRVIIKGSGDDAVFNAIKSQLDADTLNYTVLNSNGTSNGMVVANSDVYIVGSIDFTGLIATKGSIYCLGSGAKEFTNTTTSNPENYLTRLAFEGIHAPSTTPPQKKIGYWFRQEAKGSDPQWTETITYIKKGSASGENSGAGVPSMKDIVTITNWTTLDL